MIININEIDKKINIFYGMVLMHGTDEDKENANIIIDWINFLEKNIGIIIKKRKKNITENIEKKRN